MKPFNKKEEFCGSRALDRMCHSGGIFPCSLPAEATATVCEQFQRCLWEKRILEKRLRTTSKWSPQRSLIKGLPVKCAQSSHSLAARVKKWGRLFGTIKPMPDTLYPLRPPQSLVPISQHSLSVVIIWKKISATIIGPRSGQTQSSPSPKQGSRVWLESARGPRAREKGG